MDVLYYHGRDVKSTDFSYDYVGKGFDQEGAGFYFTKSKKQAELYMGEDGILITAKLDYKKLLSNKEGSKCSIKQVEYMLKNSPKFEDMIYDFGETKFSALRNAINLYLDGGTSQVDTMTTIENDFYNGYSKEYLINLVKLGYDGHEAIKNEGHFIVYNPKIIEIINVEDKVNLIDEKIEKYYRSLGNFLIDTDNNLYYNNEKIGKAQVFLSKDDNGNSIIHLSDINVNEENRKQGYFDKFIKELIKVSEQEVLPITLNVSNEYGFDRLLLINIYKKYGFIENDYNDDRFIDDMYRLPNSKTNSNEVLNEENETLLDESVESQYNLEQIANEILKEAGELNYLTFKDKEVIDLLVTPILTRNLEYKKVDDNFVDIFTKGNPLTIKFIKNDYNKDISGTYVKTRGIFGRNEIELNYKTQFINDLNDDKNTGGLTSGILWYSKFYYKFHSILLHELQHAYDDYISKGKVFNKKNDDIGEAIRNINDKTNNDLVFEIYKNYLNLPHEINARFAQAIQKTRMWNLKEETWDKIINDFKLCFKDFKSNFVGWNVLDEKYKKRITNRVYKLWDSKYQIYYQLKKKENINEYIENQPIGNKKVLFQTFKGGKILQVKKKCTGNGTCNQGDINAVKITNINENDKIYTGSYVNNHIKNITPDPDNLPTYFMDKIIKNNKFKLVFNYPIENLLKTDKSFLEYYNGGDVRYDDEEVDRNSLYEPIVVVNGELLDGYSRVSRLLRNGETGTDAFVAINSINEAREVDLKYSCLMLDFKIPNWNKILGLIKEEDVYDKPSFGKETDPHCTVLYGFKDNVDVEDIGSILNMVKPPIVVDVMSVSLFKNKEFDVLKFDVKSDILDKLHNIFKNNFDNVQTYPDYHPHITICYLKSGLGDKYVDFFMKANFDKLKLESDEFTYSKPDKTKISFTIDNSKDGKIRRGFGDNSFINDFSVDKLLAGIKIEKEHTDKVSIALEIAIDHLTEDENYYKKLEKIEKH